MKVWKPVFAMKRKTKYIKKKKKLCMIEIQIIMVSQNYEMLCHWHAEWERQWQWHFDFNKTYEKSQNYKL